MVRSLWKVKTSSFHGLSAMIEYVCSVNQFITIISEEDASPTQFVYCKHSFLNLTQGTAILARLQAGYCHEERRIVSTQSDWELKLWLPEGGMIHFIMSEFPSLTANWLFGMTVNNFSWYTEWDAENLILICKISTLYNMSTIYQTNRQSQKSSGKTETFLKRVQDDPGKLQMCLICLVRISSTGMPCKTQTLTKSYPIS